MKVLACCFLLLQFIWLSDQMSVRAPPDVEYEAKLDVFQTIVYRGYPVEEHQVTTQDGYRLRMARIPRPGKKVVFLQHGLLDAAKTWVTNFKHQSLAFILYDAGYDVWMGNMRGNTYGKSHVSLSPSKDAFWEFTFNEMALFDLPAMLDFVLARTGQPNLYYVGHSQGCMIGLAGFPANPTLASKVRLFVQLAPASNLANVKGALPLFAPFVDDMATLIHWFGSGEFLPSNEFMQWLALNLCSGSVTQTLCTSIMFMRCGYDAANMNETRLPIYLAYAPAGTSSRNAVHYAQNNMNKAFNKYDFGWYKNRQIYGQSTPPEYQVWNMNVPTVVLYSAADWLATKKDIEGYLLPRLRNLVGQKDYGNLQHLDFVWGKDVYQKVYPDVLSYLSKY
jgi:lysosomal acid lipase/cholesteryl ester hydrolase